MGKKLTNLNRYISVITGIDENWFVIFEHTINYLSFGYVRLPQLEYGTIFLVLESFLLLFFSFSSHVMYFETAKRTVGLFKV